jgi:CubicO group peptidase (beta-lactamase class C family)
MADTAINPQALTESLSTLYRGPGGCAALLKNGEVIGKHVWGYANLEYRIPMTSTTILPICSISKQFVCLTLGALLKSPEAAEKADAAMRSLLPDSLAGNKDLTIERLAAMQSGIRDYWALTVLWGAQYDGIFTLEKDALEALKRLGKFHFPPGSQYSYSNVNFYVLGRVCEILGGKPLAELLQEYVFQPAGMKTAELHPDTNDRPGPSVGYEGTERTGYFPALNRIEWAGDAGIVASLDDMIAYEKYVHQQQQDPNSQYRHNSKAPTFIGGEPAPYGWGFRRDAVDGREAVGHSGGLRGFRLNRRYIADEGLSVLTMFNHDLDAPAAATYALEKMLNKPEVKTEEVTPAEQWAGAYFDEDAQLAVEVIRGPKIGDLWVNFSFHPEKLICSTPDEAKSASTLTVAKIDGDGITIHRPKENRTVTARRLATPQLDTDYTGEYKSGEIDSTFHVVGTAGMLYGSFDGYLGSGPAHLMRQLGGDVWYMSCQRALDSTAPGDWTITFTRGDDGKVSGATVGCWLARKIPYIKK